jgi:phage shock protein B
MDFFEFVIALVAIGGTFVTVWVVVLSRRREKRRAPGESRDNGMDLQTLCTLAKSMSERIDTLEAILDAEVPDWRDQHDSSNR